MLPLVVDLIDDAWNSFDGVAVHFPSDSNSTALSAPYCELFTPTTRESTKLGAKLELSLERSFPSSIVFFLPNRFALSGGYAFGSEWSGYLTLEKPHDSRSSVSGPDSICTNNDAANIIFGQMDCRCFVCSNIVWMRNTDERIDAGGSDHRTTGDARL